jgi:hypothetical protein
MTPNQYKAAIDEFGLSQELTGLFFGYSKRQGQRWATGEAPIPPAVEYAIRLMLETGKKPGDLNKKYKT